MFAKKLKECLDERGMTAAELSRLTGIGKSSISQYLYGKNVPTGDRLTSITEALGVSTEVLTGPDPMKIPAQTYDLKISVAARLLGKSVSYIKYGLINGRFEWGNAVQFPSGKWEFFINAKKFAELEHVEVPPAPERGPI